MDKPHFLPTKNSHAPQTVPSTPTPIG